MAHIAHDPDPNAVPAKGWWRELSGLLHDLFDSEELRERCELLARARAERRPARDPIAPEWLRLD